MLVLILLFTCGSCSYVYRGMGKIMKGVNESHKSQSFSDVDTSADIDAVPFRIGIDTDSLDSAAVEAISSVNDVVTVKSDTYSVHYTHISPWA